MQRTTFRVLVITVILAAASIAAAQAAIAADIQIYTLTGTWRV